MTHRSVLIRATIGIELGTKRGLTSNKLSMCWALATHCENRKDLYPSMRQLTKLPSTSPVDVERGRQRLRDFHSLHTLTEKIPSKLYADKRVDVHI